ncbi:MAG: VanZ family protein [Planctomycetes bacterium]|nr:VanZ family protein [Planctomycetota bacterium]
MISIFRRTVAVYASATPAWLRWGSAIGWAGVLWMLSARSSHGQPGPLWFSVVWNSGHVVVYFVLSILVMSALTGRPWSHRVRVLVAIAISTLYGVVDELHQSTVPGRDCSILDVCSDFVGSVLGVVLGFARPTSSSPRD